MSKIVAPWTDDQVKALNSYQDSGAFHPYTCGLCRDSNLVATTQGWDCPRCHNWKQDWALASSLTILDDVGDKFSAFLKRMSPGS